MPKLMLPASLNMFLCKPGGSTLSREHLQMDFCNTPRPDHETVAQ